MFLVVEGQEPTCPRFSPQLLLRVKQQLEKKLKITFTCFRRNRRRERQREEQTERQLESVLRQTQREKARMGIGKLFALDANTMIHT